jgi:hypothetical protein
MLKAEKKECSEAGGSMSNDFHDSEVPPEREEDLKDSLAKIIRADCFEVPGDSERARLYAKIYEEDHEDSLSLECGILVSKYYMNEKKYEEAARLLNSIIPVLRELPCECEFVSLFLRLFDCLCELIYQEDAVEEIIHRSQRSSMTLEMSEMENEKFSLSRITFLPKCRECERDEDVSFNPKLHAN